MPKKRHSNYKAIESYILVTFSHTNARKTMIRILFALASLVATASGQIAPSPACTEILPEDGCSICGAGSCMTNPDATFVFPGQPAIHCGVLQDDGFNGRIPLEVCGFLPQFLGDCECSPIVPIIPPGACPEIPPEDGCSICGTGYCITKPDAIFVFPGQPAIPCGILQDAGFNGLISLVQCGIFPQLIGDCECRAFFPTLPPSSPSPLTFNPTWEPPPPTPAPTNTGLIEPTPSGACPEIPPEGGCSICGTGSCITKPDAIFLKSFSGQPSFSFCSVLQDAGFNGRISLDECGILPPLIGDCECQPLVAPIAPTLAPTSAAPTSAAPTSAAPTSAAPTSAAPTSDAPTSDAPTSDAPTSDAPTSDAPTSDAPTSDAPTSDAPTSDAPTPSPRIVMRLVFSLATLVFMSLSEI